MQRMTTHSRFLGGGGGITLVETLAVAAALAAVAAMALPQYHRVVQDGKITEVRNG